MARRPPKKPVETPLELLENKVSATSKIQAQIDKGQELFGMPISSEQDYLELVSDEDSWVNYTKLLLTQLFTNSTLSKEFGRYPGTMVVVRSKPSMREKANEKKEHIRKRINILKSIKDRVEIIPIAKSVSREISQKSRLPDVSSGEVFVVHGHDEATKQSVARFLEKLGLKPIILHEQASQSRTIIEKIEHYSNVGYGVAIYTECDVGASKSDREQLKYRGRQNVVFEHGFLIGKLGRANVSALVKGDVEKPNDISGVVYQSMDSEDWKIELAKELKLAGYPIDMNIAFA